MSVLFVLSVLFVYEGNALWRRFQANQIKRELAKLKWTLLVALCLSFSLLTSQMAVGQTAPAPKVTRAEQYTKLLTVV